MEDNIFLFLSGFESRGSQLRAQPRGATWVLLGAARGGFPRVTRVDGVPFGFGGLLQAL